jgi:hypothetical protein
VVSSARRQSDSPNNGIGRGTPTATRKKADGSLPAISGGLGECFPLQTAALGHASIEGANVSLPGKLHVI